MKRWHEDFPRTYREWKKHFANQVENNIEWSSSIRVGRDPYEVDNTIKQIGRFRKKKTLDCGQRRCFVCHSDKFPKRERTYQERCSELKLKEGIEDLNEKNF